MAIDLSTDEIRRIVESLSYAKRAKQEGGAPLALRQSEETATDLLLAKLRTELKSLTAGSS